MRMGSLSGAIATLLLAGCGSDDWQFRSREAGAVTDQPGFVDRSPNVDTLEVDGVVTVTDGGRDGGDSGTTTDRGPIDDRATDVVVFPTDTGGLRMSGTGFSTQQIQVGQAGTLRLMDHGFESGERHCVGTVCLYGGFER